jgi:hypothetical protein
MKAETIEKRKSQYKELSKEKKRVRVYSRDKSEFGFILGEASAYTGEAGYSERCRVLWKNGKITHCCYRGMASKGNDWHIL